MLSNVMHQRFHYFYFSSFFCINLFNFNAHTSVRIFIYKFISNVVFCHTPSFILYKLCQEYANKQ